MSKGMDGAGPVGGWLLGHELARGRHGFPGDPLPGGHLGRPVDLAFWGAASDDWDADDDDDASGDVDLDDGWAPDGLDG